MTDWRAQERTTFDPVDRFRAQLTAAERALAEHQAREKDTPMSRMAWWSDVYLDLNARVETWRDAIAILDGED